MITTTNDKIQARYDELFKDEKNLFAISDRLNEMSDDPVVDDLRAIYCDEILFEITAGYIEYGDRKYFMDDPLILLFIDEERKLKHEESILKMMSAFSEMMKSRYMNTLISMPIACAQRLTMIIWTKGHSSNCLRSH